MVKIHVPKIDKNNSMGSLEDVLGALPQGTELLHTIARDYNAAAPYLDRVPNDQTLFYRHSSGAVFVLNALDDHVVDTEIHFEDLPPASPQIFHAPIEIEDEAADSKNFSSPNTYDTGAKAKNYSALLHSIDELRTLLNNIGLPSGHSPDDNALFSKISPISVPAESVKTREEADARALDLADFYDTRQIGPVPNLSAVLSSPVRLSSQRDTNHAMLLTTMHLAKPAFIEDFNAQNFFITPAGGPTASEFRSKWHSMADSKFLSETASKLREDIDDAIDVSRKRIRPKRTHAPIGPSIKG